MLHFARWKIGLVLLLVVAAVVTVLPNFFSEKQIESWPGFLPNKQVVLGLVVLAEAVHFLGFQAGIFILPTASNGS